MSRVSVTRHGHTGNYFVLNIAHTLTPSKWTVTLGLIPVPEGL